MSKDSISRVVGYYGVVPPPRPPIGLHVTRVSRVLARAFDEALADAGGSLPTWLILLNLKINPTANQREVAEAVALTEATVTHHLNGMEANGLVTRERDPANRRVHIVRLTDAGEQAFLRLRAAAIAFDRRLRHGMTGSDTEHLAQLLDRMATNVGADPHST